MRPFLKIRPLVQCSNQAPALRTRSLQGHLALPCGLPTPHSPLARYMHGITNDGIEIDNHKFNWLSLRDSCTCPRCVHPSTRQRLFAFSDIPRDVQHEAVKRISPEEVEISWKNDILGYEGHKSIVPLDYFENNASFGRRMKSSNNYLDAVSWDRDTYTRTKREFEYDEYMNSKERFQEAVQELGRHGFVFIHNAPIDQEAIRGIAERIGPLRNTFYGETWDVRSKPSAKNVAYTSDNLGFHHDLMYMANPPGIQLLHVLKSSTSGGESLFSDCVNAVEKLQRKADEALLKALRDFPVTYHYHNDGQWYQYTRPTLEGGMLQMMRAMADNVPVRELKYGRHYEFINYSPQFQGSFQISSHDSHDDATFANRVQMKDYHKAVKALKRELEKPEHIYETKMKEGTCVIFNNRRVVHARRAFSSMEGERWLKGCYIDTDCLMNQWRVLNEERQGSQSAHGDRIFKSATDVEKVFGKYGGT